jgi:hypothetical protein
MKYLIFTLSLFTFNASTTEVIIDPYKDIDYEEIQIYDLKSKDDLERIGNCYCWE